MSCVAAPGSLSLNLDMRNLDKVAEGAFKGLTVPLIDLSHNNLKTLPGNTLCGNATGAQSVLTIVLDHNFLSTFDVNTFAGCANLTDLSVQYNAELKGPFPNDMLKDSALTLQFIRMSGHGMTVLPVEWLEGLEGLHELVLREGPLTTITNPLPKALGTNLTRLDLSHNRINTLPSACMISNLTKLEALQLRANAIADVKSLRFDHTLSVSTVDLTMNKITTLEEGCLYRLNALKGLRSLDLSGNGLHTIAQSVFGNSSWPHLTTLNLAHNALTRIDIPLFKGLGNLTDLVLSYNQIAVIEPTVWTGLAHLLALRLRGNALKALLNHTLDDVRPTLETLDMSHNQIQSVATDVFVNMTKLRTLDLSFNNIASLPDDTFGCCGSNLVDVRLESNRLTSLSEQLTHALLPAHMTMFSIARNPLSCCTLRPWLDGRFKEIMTSTTSASSPDYNCTDMGEVYTTPSFGSSNDTALHLECTFGRYGPWTEWGCQCEDGFKEVSKQYRQRDCDTPAPLHASKGCIASGQGDAFEKGEACDCATVVPTTTTMASTATTQTQTGTSAPTETAPIPTPIAATPTPSPQPTHHKSSGFVSTIKSMFLSLLFVGLVVSVMYLIHNWAIVHGHELSLSDLSPRNLLATLQTLFHSITRQTTSATPRPAAANGYTAVPGGGYGGASYTDSSGMDNSFSAAADRQYQRIVNDT
ncbi:hypothetical protein, variant [Sphaeroforma arctica JP610]|nr:hypothetical protein, variant [Sphaeroforma arctica JP610]KNC81675.1 hypothetical protein, variant [Sphaeroforma arctica JP610]|eukprot:XP_014155577.1 hypothetical protein, variant [Sphaeroforma arctica JP610]